MAGRKLQIVVLAAVFLLLLGVAIAAFQLGAVASAQEGSSDEPAMVQAMTAALLQYQGRLSDPSSGEAVPDGSYTMTLRLYGSATGGSPLWSEVKDVPVRDGLFSTVLGDTTALNRNILDGRALWLGIKVGADAEATPRQQVLPVAYALSLVPGANVQANGGSPALRVGNAGSGQALAADGPVLIDGDLTVNGKLNGGSHVHSSHNNNPSAHHTRYSDAEAISAALSSPEIVTQYEFQDHIYGGMHSNRALAYGSINEDGTIASATSNVSSRWDNLWKCYEITIDGHTYEWQSYVTVVTPVVGGFTSAWSRNGKLCVGIYDTETQPIKGPFQFVTFQP